MNYKGAYDNSASYNVGDVAVFTDNVAYEKTNAAPAGTKPHDVRYWARLGRPLQDVVLMFHTMLTDMNAAISGADDTALIAPEYTKTTYAAGAIVIHDKKLYKAKSAIATAENWTAAHWDETKVGSLIETANTNIATANTSISDLQGVVFDDKTLVLGSSTASSTKKWAVTVDDTEGLEVNEVVEEAGT